MNFDEKMARLREITVKLESEKISLDEGIKLFEEGSKLAKECYQMLNEAKGKITIIKEEIKRESHNSFFHVIELKTHFVPLFFNFLYI